MLGKRNREGNEDGEEEKFDWEGGDFRVYMREKERKLREQFQVDEEDVEGNYFHGVTIWVDGLTNPGRDDLRQWVYAGGGKFETYFHPRVVTHVVATHFPKFKVEQMRKAMVSSVVHLYVVTPEWIVQCREQKKRLPENQFQVPGMRDETQNTLTNNFLYVSENKTLEPSCSDLHLCV